MKNIIKQQTVKPCYGNTSYLLLLLITLFSVGDINIAFAKSNSSALINWSSEEGMNRLSQSKYKVDFFPLANHFESQNNKIYCGVASSTIVLNALRVRNDSNKTDLPPAKSVLTKEDTKYVPIVFSPYFDRYTQNNIFTERSKSKLEILGKPIEINGKEKRDIGLQLHQLKTLLESHNLKVIKKSLPENYNLGELRDTFKKNLSTKDDYLLINYTRKTLNQKGGGHISPVGAYDESSDSILIMDVNSNKADWVWVSLRLIAQSMATFDTVENRGYLLISEK